MNADGYASQFLVAVSQSVDVEFKERYCLPGDDVTELLNKRAVINKKIILSRGLIDNDNRITVTIAGVLKYRTPPSTYWIESKSTLYTPLIGDQVVGIIEDKGAEFYRVNILSSSTTVTLNRQAFDGATKRNKPELKRGDIIYARIMFTHKDLDTELTCMVGSGPKKDWSSGESIYGELPANGLVLLLPVSEVRKMLASDNILLNALGKHFQFEIALGMNGLVWFKGVTGPETIAIRNALINVTNSEWNTSSSGSNNSSDHSILYINAMAEKLAQICKHITSSNEQAMSIQDDDS